MVAPLEESVASVIANAYANAMRRACGFPESVAVDMVNHPSHYTSHPKGIECIDVIEECDNFNLAQVMRYVWRVAFGGKADDMEDLRKAKFYLERAIDRESLNL